MRVKFIGDPGATESPTKSCTMFGVVFPLDEPIDVSALSEPLKAKLQGNKHFEVCSQETPRRTRKSGSTSDVHQDADR